MLGLPARDQLGRDRLDGVGGDREADTLVAAGVALDLSVDADDLALSVEERTARVAVVDRGVGLDRVVDRKVVRRGHLTVQCADDSGSNRSLEPERAADGDDLVPDSEVARVAE